MRRVWISAVFMLGTIYAGGQQGNPAQAARVSEANVKAPPAGAVTAAEAAGAAAPEAQTVKVYEPRRPVIAPRLLPPAEPLDFPKNCKDTLEGESELSLLVDTSGHARNILFLKPSGTLADPFAIKIASQDRFAPGTLDGKPVVVAETLDISMQACIGEEPNAAGKLEEGWLLKAPARQKLKKPKDPPQVVELAPLETPLSAISRKVDRPDFFGNGESAPVLLYSDYARYTPLFQGRNGVCQVSLVVDAHGMPQDLHVLKSIDPGLDMAALEAVQKYRFFPAIKGYKPVPAAIVVSVNFTPPQN
jgi:TonB family protein